MSARVKCENSVQMIHRKKFIQISILIPKTHTTEEEDPIVTKFIEKIPKLMDGKSDQNDDTVRNNFD